jgi:hypothetical protein
MLRAMARPTMSLIPTRESLLSRLRDWADDESWSEFFHTYWRMLYEVACGRGCVRTKPRRWSRRP